jgi:hypothetical protein
MTDFAQRGIYDASLNAFPSVRHCVYAGNVICSLRAGKGNYGKWQKIEQCYFYIFTFWI